MHRLAPGRQAVLVLVHLRRKKTFAGLAAAFGVGTATAHRYVTEVVELLAELAPDLCQALRGAARKAYVILDGTPAAIDRLSGVNDRSYHSGKHRRHGVNIQFLTDPHGRLLGAGGAIATPYKRTKRRRLGKHKKLFNRHHARIRAMGERGAPTLRSRHILRKARCSPSRLTAVVQAILTLHHQAG
ncbi:transposase family protein [Spirillospora sp. CA-255316]